MAGGLQEAGAALGVVKEVEDIADKALDLKEKLEIMEDDKQRRKVDAVEHKVNVVFGGVNQAKQAADGMIDLVDKGLDLKNKFEIIKYNKYQLEDATRRMGRQEIEEKVDMVIGIYTKIAPIAGPMLNDAGNLISSWLKRLTETRSKVKMGFCRDCKLAMFGSRACIVKDLKDGDIVFLTSDTISAYSFVKEKVKQVGLKRKTYYYYEVKFKDGQESYIRMSGKYRDALERYAVPTAEVPYGQEVEKDTF